MTAISIFDLDRTLTIRPTYSAFLLYAIFRTAPWRLLLIPSLAVFYLIYSCGLISRKRLKEAMHRVALGGRTERALVERIAADFALRLARDGIFPQAHALLERRRNAGRRLILATAAPSLYAEPLATFLGMDDVIATQICWQGDHIYAGIRAENCYAAVKRERISAWLRSEHIPRDAAHVEFFSDHITDLPAFEWADEPIAVNPSKALLAVAQERGWPIIDWRRPRK